MVSATCTNCSSTEANVPKGADPMDGSLGCFTFKYTMGPNPPSPPTGGIGAVFDFTITPPAHCVLAADCPDQGAFATSSSGVSAPDPVSIGNFPDTALTMLPAACTPWYSQVTFDTEDGSHVTSAIINNNIPLDCCGDGLITGDEVCDDGNFLDGDGCTADCSLVELGFTCPTPGQPCEAICGDGLIRGDETCDDQNVDAADCCMDCQKQEDCALAPAPVLGPFALGAVVLSLLALGLFASRRHGKARQASR
jgi:cysteine-rich repeat protein